MTVQDLMDKLAGCVATDEVYIAVDGLPHHDIVSVEPETVTRAVTIYAEVGP